MATVNLCPSCHSDRLAESCEGILAVVFLWVFNMRHTSHDSNHDDGGTF